MNPSEPPSHRWEVDGPSAPFPYIPGFSIEIRPCTSPTASEIQTQLHAEESLKARYPPGTHKISAIEYCIAQPYCELETSHQPRGHTLHVDSITTRPASDIWWNKVQCHLDDDRESKYTAKIYDPVYASDVTWAHAVANDSFNNEVDAFFSGAWMMDVAVPSKDFGGVDHVTTRPVPLLLFEAVEAANLATTYFRYYYTSGYMEPQPHLPQAWRHEVLAKIYEARALLAHAGVHAEVAPDGIFVGTNGLEDGRLDVRVSIANFERACISELGKRTGERPEQPVSPIETCWDEVKYGLQRLAWDEWKRREDLKYYRQWLVQRWGESTEYRPLPEDLRKRIACGKWEEAST
ncbi:hypothetical protein INS49_002308 [Diaporthe citri]|uniref:uncharacterized protein n=1 Tax=Diaporthe citri TaxID=83186 RepID=UPI001C7ED7FE|nr:uncharacterized protein INS49_002308 [Diaporthe citri]KAG6368108.1 hypothetical protein INS49_002308 [Diaporthe citri]